MHLQDETQQKGLDPFYESQENHNLIGVANIFLEVLFHDVKLDYHTPIISQQGEVAGRLQVCYYLCIKIFTLSALNSHNYCLNLSKSSKIFILTSPSFFT